MIEILEGGMGELTIDLRRCLVGCVGAAHCCGFGLGEGS